MAQSYISSRANTTTILWPTATADRPCPVCRKTNRCRVAPDGTAAVCWRGGGKVVQCGTGSINGTGYIGAAHRLTIAPAKSATIYPTARAAIDAAGRQCGGVYAAEWMYTDASGSEAMRIIRYALPGGKKSYRPIHPTGDGYAIGDPPGPLPLYFFSKTVGNTTEIVFVCEGEKAADAARSIGLLATSSAHGAASAEKTDWTPLAGRDVVILPDNDAPGTKYAGAVAAILSALTPPAKIKIVHLPGLPGGGDIVEYIEARDSAESTDIAASVTALANGTPYLSAADSLAGPVMTCLADVEARQINWLWPGRIPLGRITLLVGRPGEGNHSSPPISQHELPPADIGPMAVTAQRDR